MPTVSSRGGLLFLNAVLGQELAAPVARVTLLNPYNKREFLDDKLSIVDVKVQDQAGHYSHLMNYPNIGTGPPRATADGI